MKVRLPFILALLSALPAVAGDFIRQIQTVNGIQLIYQIDISGDSGQVISKPLGGPNAVFQLYTTVTSNNSSTLTKLDEKTVGTYVPMPTAAAQILSEDPYYPPRTRADRPYGLQVTVANASSDSNASDQARKVQMIRSYQMGDPNTYALTTTKGDYAGSTTFTGNGVYTSNGIIQVLPVTSPMTASKAVGTETFTVYTYPVSGSTQSQLASATVQIWPVATAIFTNIEDGKTYKAVPGNVSVSLRDLYPKSTTYVQVYSGAPALGKTGTVLPSTPVAFDTYSPQNAMLTLADLENSMKDATGKVKDGLYTLEVVTLTPFGAGQAERVTYLSFTIARTLSVSGGINTLAP